MSSFVCSPELIARVSSFVVDVIQDCSKTCNIRWHLAYAIRNADRRPVRREAQACHSLPLVDPGFKLTPAQMSVMLQELNEEAYDLRYPQCKSTFDADFWTAYYKDYSHPRFRWNDVDPDELIKMARSLECFAYQCDEYDGTPQFLHVLQVLIDAIKSVYIDNFVPAYRDSKWGE